MILIVAAEAVVDYEWPFQTWERDLRSHIGQIRVDPERGNVEEVSFIAGILRSVLYAGSDESFVQYLKPTYYTFAGIVLATVLFVPPRFRRPGASPADRPTTADPGTAAMSGTADSPEAPAAKRRQGRVVQSRHIHWHRIQTHRAADRIGTLSDAIYRLTCPSIGMRTKRGGSVPTICKTTASGSSKERTPIAFGSTMTSSCQVTRFNDACPRVRFTLIQPG